MTNARRYLVTGIGTGIGKTLTSAVMVAALGADYWKPVQAGNLDHTDSDIVRELAPHPRSFVHPETWRLSVAQSPHWAARIDGVRISLESIVAPTTSNDLVMEGAGGLLVPVNESDLLVDAFAAMSPAVVVVSRNYLGSINHTLLTLEALAARRMQVAGIVFSGGTENPDGESFILRRTRVPCLLRIPELARIDADVVRALATEWPR